MQFVGIWYVGKKGPRNGIYYVGKQVRHWPPDSRRKSRFKLPAVGLWLVLAAGWLAVGGPAAWLLMGRWLAEGLAVGLRLAG